MILLSGHQWCIYILWTSATKATATYMLFVLDFVPHFILFEAFHGKPVQQSIMLLGLINAVFKPSHVPLWVIVQHCDAVSVL